MSICSNLSQVSVNLRGSEINIEVALDMVIRELQQHLNDVQTQLRRIAVSSDQKLGDTDDFDDLKNSIRETDELEDNIDEMCELFKDLRGMAGDLAFVPETKQERDWVKAHKATRKALIADRKKNNDERRKAENAQYKATKSKGDDAKASG